MNKNEILNLLKKRCSSSVRLPKYLGMSVTNGCLTIEIPAERTLENMQSDYAAFDGWALVIYSWMKEVESVVIKWDEPTLINDLKRLQHYQRFLYRVKRFCESFSWAEISLNNLQCINDLLIKKKNKILLNTPFEERPRLFNKIKQLEEYTENELEYFILSNAEVKNRFIKTFDLKFADNQLLVGVFKDSVSKKTRIFPGGNSAIDIWGITNDNENCCLFELKDADNRKVGALSEMLFYSFIIQDVINGVIEFDSTRHFGLLNILSAKRIKCYLLAPNKHQLINNDVFKLLNNSSSGIEYGNVIINDNFTFQLDYL